MDFIKQFQNMLNEYFSNVVKSSTITDNSENTLPVDAILDPVTAAIEKYDSYPSVLLIKGHCEDIEAFRLRKASVVEVVEQIVNLNIKRASLLRSIPAKKIKENAGIVAPHLLDFFHVSLDENLFPNKLKDGNVC